VIDFVELTPADVIWPFDQKGEPYVLVGGGKWPRRTPVDPFPGYAHDIALVRETAARVADVWPLPFPLRVYLLHYEIPSRTNGWEQMDAGDYSTGKGKDWVCSIALIGKRTPPHPAMTRYLVAHEFAHAVVDALLLARGEEPGKDVVVEEYSKRRDLCPSPAYGGGTWHLKAEEVLANDWRILVAGVEVDFWPHPGVPRPEEVPGLREWWFSVRRDLLGLEPPPTETLGRSEVLAR
jgi:hypothetical protein